MAYIHAQTTTQTT